MFDSKVWDVCDYVEEITSIRPCYETLEEMEEDFNNKNIDLWNYPLNEVEHIIENGLNVCLVRFSDDYGGYVYRWCELPI